LTPCLQGNEHTIKLDRAAWWYNDDFETILRIGQNHETTKKAVFVNSVLVLTFIVS